MLSVFQQGLNFFISVHDHYMVLTSHRDVSPLKVVSHLKVSGELAGPPCDLNYVPSSHQKTLLLE